MIKFAQSTITGISAGYAGQALGKFAIRHKNKSNPQFNPEFSDIAVASLATLAVMLSPVPMVSKTGAGLTFILGGVIGACYEEFFKNNKKSGSVTEDTPVPPTEAVPNSNSNDLKQQTQIDKPIDAETKAKADAEKKQVKHTPPSRQELLLKQWEALSQQEQINVNKIMNDKIIDSSNMGLNATLMAKFAAEYYKTYNNLITTTNQHNFVEHTQTHINAVIVLGDKQKTLPKEEKSDLLLQASNTYESALSNNSLSRYISKDFHIALNNMLSDYLLKDNSLSHSDTK